PYMSLHSSCTLFPYTTLFRSRRVVMSLKRIPSVGKSLMSRILARNSATFTPAILTRIIHERMTGVAAGGRGQGKGPRDHAVSAQDRKSTRLNSSHQIISYAVV